MASPLSPKRSALIAIPEEERERSRQILLLRLGKGRH